jgi:ribokinase
MHKAREAGKHVMVNPAPAVELPESAFKNMDTLIMNETESEILSGSSTATTDTIELARQFLQKGVRDTVIITLGGDGLVFATAGGQSGRLDAHKVQVVDTTAAGDTFVGGYAVERARNVTGTFNYNKALKFATLAASKTVERAGAMSAIPYLSELQ